ncbi:hypothetical protein ACFP8W_20540 [Nocardioides hankookensis]|uniref:Uncharacterized protein n=1 Tax=Nocardioides hankookensis TaxID=443157 RepID=A0ABW1LLF9_9ACTN
MTATDPALATVRAAIDALDSADGLRAERSPWNHGILAEGCA